MNEMYKDHPNPSMKYLKPNHADFELQGKPALVLMHMQNNLVGAKGGAMPGWIPYAKKAIDDSGMIDVCIQLKDLFHELGLPVVYVQADGNPFNGYVPAYGTMFEQIKKSPANTDFASKAERDYYWDVIDEMEFDPKRDYKLCNLLCQAFNDSGLEHLLRALGVETIVWGGFSNQAAIYSSSIVAADCWFNNIIPADATVVYLAPTEPGFDETTQEKITEAFVGFMEPQTSKVTDAATVMKKVREIYGK